MVSVRKRLNPFTLSSRQLLTRHAVVVSNAMQCANQQAFHNSILLHSFATAKPNQYDSHNATIPSYQHKSPNLSPKTDISLKSMRRSIWKYNSSAALHTSLKDCCSNLVLAWLSLLSCWTHNNTTIQNSSLNWELHISSDGEVYMVWQLTLSSENAEMYRHFHTFASSPNMLACGPWIFWGSQSFTSLPFYKS